MNQGVAG